MPKSSITQSYDHLSVTEVVIWVATVSITEADLSGQPQKLKQGLGEMNQVHVPGDYGGTKDGGDESWRPLESHDAAQNVRESTTRDSENSAHENQLPTAQEQLTHNSEGTSMGGASDAYSGDAAKPITHSAEDIINDLKSRVLVFRTEAEGLKQLAEEKDVQLQNLRKERDELVRQRQTSILKIRKLNDIIIKTSHQSDGPLDNEISAEMSSIRNNTLEIINGHFGGDFKFRKDIAEQFHDNYYRHFYLGRLMPIQSPESRRRLLIAMIFEELRLFCFDDNAKRFGVTPEMEQQLQTFERQIEASAQVDTEEVLEWRSRTVSYARRLNINCRDTIKGWTRHILSILKPMSYLGVEKGKRPDQAHMEHLEKALCDLASASLRLALRFRSSKAKYELKSYSDNTCLASCDEMRVKLTDREGPVSQPMDYNKLFIFCTMFGFLVKTVSEPGSEPQTNTMEPAWVIIYEKQPNAGLQHHHLV